MQEQGHRPLSSIVVLRDGTCLRRHPYREMRSTEERQVAVENAIQNALERLERIENRQFIESTDDRVNGEDVHALRLRVQRLETITVTLAAWIVGLGAMLFALRG